jgi:hypothetical protein
MVLPSKRSDVGDDIDRRVEKNGELQGRSPVAEYLDRATVSLTSGCDETRLTSPRFMIRSRYFYYHSVTSPLLSSRLPQNCSHCQLQDFLSQTNGLLRLQEQSGCAKVEG